MSATHISDFISSLGLILDIAGAVLLFKFGLPPEFDPYGRDFIITSNTDREAEAKGRRYRLWGQVGIILLILGFIFQLIGTWID